MLNLWFSHCVFFLSLLDSLSHSLPDLIPNWLQADLDSCQVGSAIQLEGARSALHRQVHLRYRHAVFNQLYSHHMTGITILLLFASILITRTLMLTLLTGFNPTRWV